MAATIVANMERERDVGNLELGAVGKEKKPENNDSSAEKNFVVEEIEVEGFNESEARNDFVEVEAKPKVQDEFVEVSAIDTAGNDNDFVEVEAEEIRPENDFVEIKSLTDAESEENFIEISEVTQNTKDESGKEMSEEVRKAIEEIESSASNNKRKSFEEVVSHNNFGEAQDNVQEEPVTQNIVEEVSAEELLMDEPKTSSF